MYRSTPHFLDGDRRYLVASGLSDPIKELHETVIDIEPNTGITLQANKRIQVNVEVIPLPGIDALEHIKEYMVFPLLWADEVTINFINLYIMQFFLPIKFHLSCFYRQQNWIKQMLMI